MARGILKKTCFDLPRRQLRGRRRKKGRSARDMRGSNRRTVARSVCSTQGRALYFVAWGGNIHRRTKVRKFSKSSVLCNRSYCHHLRERKGCGIDRIPFVSAARSCYVLPLVPCRGNQENTCVGEGFAGYCQRIGSDVGCRRSPSSEGHIRNPDVESFAFLLQHVVESGDDVTDTSRAVPVKDLDRQQFDSPVDPGCAQPVVSRCADNTRKVRSVAVIVHRICRVRRAHQVSSEVAVFVASHVGCQILMVVLYSRIKKSYIDLLAAGGYFPCSGCVYRLHTPGGRKLWIIRRSEDFEDVVRRRAQHSGNLANCGEQFFR